MRDCLNAAATIADLGFQADPATITAHVIGSSSAAAELPPAIEAADERRDPEAHAQLIVSEGVLKRYDRFPQLACARHGPGGHVVLRRLLQFPKGKAGGWGPVDQKG
jgi:hypothetical protein